MSKKIILINTANLPCPGSHYLHTIKFLSSFKYFDYEYHEVNNINDIEKYEDTENNIFYLSNHGIPNGNTELDILSAKYKESIFILWSYHWHLDYITPRFNKWVLTGEHYRQPPILDAHLKTYNFQNKLDNYIPLTFAANIHPKDLVRRIKFTDYEYDCNYVGACYNSDWMNVIYSKLNAFIRATPPFIPENIRVNSFKNSLCSLGFQSPENKKNFCITERIFEAMSYGCLVFVDSEFISDETNQSVVYVSSVQELVDKLLYFKNNPIELSIIVNRAYDYIQNYGTYYHTCQNFLNGMKKLNYMK